MDYTGDADELTQLSDLVDAMSLPAITTQEAVDSMQKIVNQANEIEKKDREETIVLWVTSFLFFIPIAGEAAEAASLVAAHSILRLIGTVGDVAVTIYDVVSNPDSAFLAVFSLVAGAGVGRSGFKKAAKARRSISQKDYDGLGNVKTNLDKVEGIRGIMCLA
jgi:hypothetical protein